MASYVRSTLNFVILFCWWTFTEIDFVLELLPYQLDPEKIPSGISKIIYKFDSESIRWRLDTASSENKKYTFTGDTWNEII